MGTILGEEASSTVKWLQHFTAWSVFRGTVPMGNRKVLRHHNECYCGCTPSPEVSKSPDVSKCPNVTLESKTMAGENILLKTTEKASFYPSLLSPSLPL